ncbi:MAG: hypothetical protein AAB482_04455 [Patescibacteria group bacterium]
MSNNIKLLFIVAIILLIVTGVALFFAFRQNPAPTGSDGGIVGGGGDEGSLPSGSNNASNNGVVNLSDKNEPLTLPVSEDEKKKLVQLSTDPVVGPTINKAGDRVRFFKQGTGNLFETTLDGSGGETRLSNITIKNIADAIWSPSKTYATISSYDTDSVNNFWLHTTGTSTIQTGEYSNTLLSSAYSPTEDKLASIVKSGSQYAVSISNPDGKNAKTIYTTKIPDFEISWPSKNLFALKTKSSAFAPSLLGTIPVGGGLLTVISSEEQGLNALWAPDGTHYLTSESISGGRDLKLEIRSLDAKESTAELSLKTLPEKCAFSKKEKLTLFCAIPNNIGSGPLPDAWWQKKVEFQDTLWATDILTGESKLLLQGGGFDMTHLFTSPNENYIFFVNKRDSTLWSLRLL